MTMIKTAARSPYLWAFIFITAAAISLAAETPRFATTCAAIAAFACGIGVHRHVADTQEDDSRGDS